MTGKLGLILGFAAGYALGTQAGRERYEQIVRWAGGLTGRGRESISQSWPGPQRPTA